MAERKSHGFSSMGSALWQTISVWQGCRNLCWSICVNFINLTPNALSKLSGLPILPSNNHYEWVNGSCHEWLPQVMSVPDVPACLPTQFFYNSGSLELLFPFSCSCDIHEIEQTIHWIMESQNSPGCKGPQRIIWPNSLNAQNQKGGPIAKALTVICKYTFSTSLYFVYFVN